MRIRESKLLCQSSCPLELTTPHFDISRHTLKIAPFAERGISNVLIKRPAFAACGSETFKNDLVCGEVQNPWAEQSLLEAPATSEERILPRVLLGNRIERSSSWFDSHRVAPAEDEVG